MTFTRQALYAWLDAHQVPFRDSVGVLIRKRGTTPSAWREGAHDLFLPMDPVLLPDLAELPSTTVDERTPRLSPPRQISAYMRATDDPVRNVAVIEAALVSVFGPPNRSTVTNAISREWSDPVEPTCNIRLLGFLRNDPLNRMPNSRHEAISGSATEASVTITPDWWPPLNDKDAALLTGGVPVLDPADDARCEAPSVGYAGYGPSRPLPEDCDCPAGFWRSAEGDRFLLVSRQRRFVMFDRDDIQSIRHDILLPAKGGGGVGVSITVRLGRATQSFGLLSDHYGAEGTLALAERVAKTLGVPLKCTEDYDC